MPATSQAPDEIYNVVVASPVKWASFCAPDEPHNLQMIGRTDIKDHRKRPFDQSCTSDSPSGSKRNRPSPPTAAVLYHLAVSAHIASHVHLQQVFVPSTVSFEAADSPIIYTAEASGSKHHFRHDARAAGKAVGLLLFSLDSLKTALGLQDLSYAERLNFAIEFGLVALELLSVADHDLRGRSRDYPCIATDLLKEELQDVLGALVGQLILSG